MSEKFPFEHEKNMLNRIGYSFLKSELTDEQLEWIRDKLTVTPIASPGFEAGIKPFSVFGESPTRIYTPRFWGLKYGGPATIDKLRPGRLTTYEFPHLVLRDYQEPIIGSYLSEIGMLWGGHPGADDKIAGSGLICVPCGFGKTVMAIWLIGHIRRKTAIVVHKEFLAAQWREELQRFYPGIQIGIIQGKKCIVDDCDVVICMLQTLCQNDYPEEILGQFGFTIFDECHHLGAEVFSRSLAKLNSRIMLGLSATPQRKDGLGKVFMWYLGKIVYQIKVRTKEDVIVRCLRFDSEIHGYRGEPTNWKGQVQNPTLINQVTGFAPRTAAIIQQIRIARLENRTILILSDRREHLAEFHRVLSAEPAIIGRIGYYIGGMKQRDLDNTAETANVILGTFQMAAEGMNIPRLDTVFFTSPKSDVAQSVGRILRKRPEDRTIIPMIFDIVDSHPSLTRQYTRSRLPFYKKCEYVIETWIWNERESRWNHIKSHDNNNHDDYDEETTEIKPQKCLISITFPI